MPALHSEGRGARGQGAAQSPEVSHICGTPCRGEGHREPRDREPQLLGPCLHSTTCSLRTQVQVLPLAVSVDGRSFSQQGLHSFLRNVKTRCSFTDSKDVKNSSFHFRAKPCAKHFTYCTIYTSQQMSVREVQSSPVLQRCGGT